jgi:CubicO group peptidase (beta-lactamase class C family)
MKRLFLILFSIALFASTSPAQSSITQHPEVAGAIKLLEAWIESQMAYRGQPGISVGVVYDQKLIWARGFGYADVEKKIAATPATIYRMASVTKTFTATAIMQLRDAGKLNLDDPVVKHLPWFKIKSSFADAPAITIRHLLTHTSGLPREAAFPYWMDANFPTIEQIKETLPNQEAAFAPETRWKYSNLALALAGEIVAVVSGSPYDVYVRDHILEPLGMSSSTMLFPEAQRSRLAVGYGRRMPEGKREIRPYMDCKGITPAANLSSTVEDLARYLAFELSDGVVNGKTILKSSTLREMQRVHWLRPDWRGGAGIGFAISRASDRTIVGHGGSLAGYRTQISFSPDEKLGVIVLTNSDDGNPGFYVNQIFTALAPALKKAVPPAAAMAQADPEWDKYAGKYRSPWGDSEVLIVNGALVMIDPTADNPMETMVRLVAEGRNRFKITTENQNYGGAVGEIVTFELGANGEVVRMKTGESYTFRLRGTP